VRLDGLAHPDGVPHLPVPGVDPRVDEGADTTASPEDGVLGHRGLGGDERAHPVLLTAVAGKGDTGGLVHGVLDQAHAVETFRARPAPRLVHAAVAGTVDASPTVAVGHAGLGSGNGHDLVTLGRGGGSGGVGGEGEADEGQ
jgi:hypothetical protein